MSSSSCCANYSHKYKARHLSTWWSAYSNRYVHIIPSVQLQCWHETNGSGTADMVWSSITRGTCSSLRHRTTTKVIHVMSDSHYSFSDFKSLGQFLVPYLFRDILFCHSCVDSCYSFCHFRVWFPHSLSGSKFLGHSLVLLPDVLFRHSRVWFPLFHSVIHCHSHVQFQSCQCLIPILSFSGSRCLEIRALDQKILIQTLKATDTLQFIAHDRLMS